MKEKYFWETIWLTGLERAKVSQIRSDDSYNIVKSVKDKELINKDLINDPVWVKTMEEALNSKVPSVAFEYWMQEGWLIHALPEISNLWGRTQPELYHPEIDTGIHAMMVIDRAAYNNASIDARWAALCHDFGKSITPIDKLPSHICHEIKGVPLVEKRIAKWGFSEERKQLLLKATEHHGTMHNINKFKPLSIIQFIERLDLKSPKMLKDFCDVVTADDQGRKTFFNNQPRNTSLLIDIVNLLESMNLDSYMENDLILWEAKKTQMKTLDNYSESWFTEHSKNKFMEKRKQFNLYSEIKNLIEKHATSNNTDIITKKIEKAKL